MNALLICSENRQRPDLDSVPVSLKKHRRAIARRLGVQLDIRSRVALEGFASVVADAVPDMVLLQMTWDRTRDDVLAVTEQIRQRNPAVPLILLDQSDQTASPFLGGLEHVDLMVKSQVLRDRQAYVAGYRSGFIFTDYLEQERGYDLQGWSFGTRADPAELDKIVPGWNLAVGTGFDRRLRWGAMLLPWKLRPFDFHCRVEPPSQNAGDWYGRLRRDSAEALRAAAGRYRCTPWPRVSYRRYLSEMSLSRVVFSPFGWGEVCFRDYEAVALGAVLLKPSMEHVQTNPNVYQAYETYVPVKWDLSDLPQACDWCMQNPDRCRQITRNARRVLRDYLNGGFYADLKRMLEDAIRRRRLAAP